MTGEIAADDMLKAINANFQKELQNYSDDDKDELIQIDDDLFLSNGRIIAILKKN